LSHRFLLRRSGGETTTVQAEAGVSLLEAIALGGPSAVESPCGGKALCGKCRVKASGILSPPKTRERELLSEAELGSGIRLACLALIEGEAEVELPGAGAQALLAGLAGLGIKPDPPVRSVSIIIPMPEAGPTRDDEERLLEALAAALPPGEAPDRVRMGALPGLALASRAACDGGRAELRTVVSGREVLSVAPGGARRRAYGVGVDIGTTTVVCALVDLETGELPARRAELNAQRTFGSDVISRIAATIDRPGALEAQSKSIRCQVSRMARSLATDAGAELGDLIVMAIAGNATMIHLLAGVPPAAMAFSPFSPAFTRGRLCSPAELGLDLDPSCVVRLLPGLAAYVGSDIVSGIAAVGMADSGGPSLFLDLGTNGEIALGGGGGILCCATAAGPAFEGVGVERGMGGVEGAVDAVWPDSDGIAYSTLGAKPAAGICGSGIVDALAFFLDCGLVDASGRIAGASEAASLPPRIASLRSEGPEGPRLHIDRARGVYLSQADVRAFQSAKAAIAAGVDILLSSSDMAEAQVERLFLAGSFGSCLDERSAARIGLFPPGLADRVVVAGNASARGAAAACLSRAALEACEKVRGLCSYVELSAHPDFTQTFVDRMAFPETGRTRGGGSAR
jgi:uncharacterized 2Fe-2S/4Fe-4S cluster protein (DUF4445 family)